MPKPRFNIYDKNWTSEVARKIEDNFKQVSKVSGSQIYANTIEPTSMKAGLLFNQMATGAIKFLGYSYRSNTVRSIAPGANVFTDVLQDDNATPVQVTATTQGGDVYIFAGVSAWSNPAGYKNFRILMDGSVAATPAEANISYLVDQVTGAFAVFKKSSITAGSHTFKMQINVDSGITFAYRNATLFAIEVKS